MQILVPVDGSKFSAAAVDFVASRATLIGNDPAVELINVQPPIPPRAARIVGKSVVADYHAEESAKVLKPASAVLQKSGVTARTRERVGHAAEQIAAVADKDDVDLIVMGTHGHGALGSLVLGSVASGVLARTRTPVLLVHGKSAPKSDSLRVGLALDGSKFSREAARYVMRHMDLFGAAPRITLISVVPDFAAAIMPDMAGVALPAFTAEEIKSMQDRAFARAVEPAHKVFQKHGVATDSACLVGNAGDELARYAAKQKLDVLVLGSHGHGAFKRAVLGSVSTRVAAHCEVPLLIVR